MTGHDPEIRIRPFRRRDADAVAALLRPLLPAETISGAGLLHERETDPPRGRVRRWVALRSGEIVGWAYARLITSTSVRGIGSLWVAVRPEHRRRGAGGRLHELAQAHLHRLAARELRTYVEDDPAGLHFAEARSYRPVRSTLVWALDPRTVDLADLPARRAAAAAEGFRLLPLRELLDRPRDLHRLYAAVVRDMPWDAPLDNLPFARWQRQVLEGPLLDRDGSFVVLAGDEPVSLAWLLVDRRHGVAENEMTGTLRPYRHRGLARLAKLATIRWAAEHGVTRIGSGNDSANDDMIALNEHLGYRPLYTSVELARPGLSPERALAIHGAAAERAQARIRSPAGS